MTTNGAEDRLLLLLAQSEYTGIDFVYVYPTQDRLDVYFLRTPETLDTPLPGSITVEQVRIENTRDDSLPAVPINNLAWAVVDGHTVMRLDVPRPDSFALHRLTVNDPRIDDYYARIDFSFQADCETGIDCEPDPAPPYPDEFVDFPVDYTARDFLSIRQALFDFASQRYPRWLDRLEADVGVMLIEVLAAMGDEFAYYQDRIAREAYIQTSTQRRSLRALARLVDYELDDGAAATTWLEVIVAPADSGTIPTGTAVHSADNALTFEIGTGLYDPNPGYEVRAGRNALYPYYWDEDDLVLPAGSTQLDVAGDQTAANVFDLPSDGLLVVVQTNPDDPGEPAFRFFTRITDMVALTDPLTGETLTRLTWDTPTPYPMNKLDLRVSGNILPVTAGTRREITFRVTPSGDPLDIPGAVARMGANGISQYRFSLTDTDLDGLVWLYDVEAGGMRPEVRLYRAREVDGEYERDEAWVWRRSLMGVASSLPADKHFTLEDGMWRRVVGYPIPGSEFVHADYASPDGYTIRFGDGEFGMIPGSDDVFIVEYRLNTGENIPRDTLTRMGDPPVAVPSLAVVIDAVTNLVAAVDAREPESADSVRVNAPEAYKAITYRAVRPEDYAEAVQRLDWVQAAGATMRWTGSWRTIFTTADPRNAVSISETQTREMNRQIDRFRQAGQDARTRTPRYADLDIEITVCAESAVYAGDAKESVFSALVGDGGFFSPDNFTFGSWLYRGALEAAASAAFGIRAVESIRFRRRGFFAWRDFPPTERYYDPGLDTIIRVSNDPLYPERGSLRVVVKGGA